ncbi:MAG: ISKra4 family transposase, partial [Anaerolineales bacterium]
MSQAYKIVAGLDEFRAAREHYARIVQTLQAPEMGRLEHGEVEAYLWREGTELLRRLLQGHLDLRARRERRLESVRGCDGVERRQVRERCERGLMTLFGEVVVRRKGYRARDTDSVFPMDAELNLPEDNYSHGLRRRVSEEVARHAFDEAVEQVGKTTGGKVPKRQAQRLSKGVSEDFEAFYAERAAQAPEATPDPLVMSLDGKGVVMRRAGLREATRRAAERDSHKLKTRLSTGEKRNRKRMATVATVYSVAEHRRTAEQIMGLEERGDSPPRARRKRVWASLEREMSQVVEEQFREAL